MVYSRPEPEYKTPEHARKAHRRANPVGLSRLIFMVLTIGLLSLGHGITWWTGFVLLGLILFAVARLGQVWWGLWASVAVLLALAFWHLHIIPLWAALTFLALGTIQFSLSLAVRRVR